MKTHESALANLRIYTKMYEDDNKYFYGFKSINGGMSYGRLIDTFVLMLGDSDLYTVTFGNRLGIEIADVMEKWVVMRTEHLTKILITGRYNHADCRLFDIEQLRTVRISETHDSLIASLLDFKNTVGLSFEIEQGW